MADKVNVFETGTRYQHYTELLDLWSDGIEILQNTVKRFDNETDKSNLGKLLNAREMLQRRLDFLTDSEAGIRLYSSMAKQIDAILPYRTLLSEGSSAQATDKTDQQTGHGEEGPADYTTK